MHPPLQKCDQRLKTVYINGKFTAQRTTGVQRVADNLLAALDEHLGQGAGSGTHWVLLCPPAASRPGLRHIEVRQVGTASLGLHLWEQLVLPMVSRRGALLNLSGSAPALKKLQACLFHDAAVFDHPEAYTPLFSAWYRFLFRRLSKVARLVITVSEFSKRRLAHHLGLAGDRIALVHSGAGHLSKVEADLSVVDALGLRRGRFFVAVGSANPNKNHRALIEAFGALPSEEGVRLVIVGGGQGTVFAGEARAHGDDRIVRTGPIDDAQLKGLYQHAVGLVFPSLYEGYGLPPLEAMSCGCPVIASSAAAIPEVCADAALYVDPRSVSEITAAMKRLLAEPRLREQLRRNGTRRVDELSWSAAARELLSHLDAVRLTEAAVP